MLPISHDEVVHGKGSLAGKMPGDRWQRLANRAGAAGVHVGAPRQAAALHGLRAGRRPGVERGARARLVAAARPGPRRGAAAGRATSTRPTGTTPALWTQDTDAGRLPLDRRRRRRPTTSFAFVRIGAGRLDAGAAWSNFSAGAARGLPDRPAARRARGRRCSTPTPATTAARAWATSARCDAEDVPWHGHAGLGAAADPAAGRALAAPPQALAATATEPGGAGGRVAGRPGRCRWRRGPGGAARLRRGLLRRGGRRALGTGRGCGRAAAHPHRGLLHHAGAHVDPGGGRPAAADVGDPHGVRARGRGRSRRASSCSPCRSRLRQVPPGAFASTDRSGLPWLSTRTANQYCDAPSLTRNVRVLAGRVGHRAGR